MKYAGYYLIVIYDIDYCVVKIKILNSIVYMAPGRMHIYETTCKIDA